MKNLGKSIAKIIIAFSILLILSAIHNETALLAALLVLVYAMVAAFRKAPYLGRVTAWPIALITLVAIGATSASITEDQEARLAALRIADEDTYLAELQNMDEGRWLNELESLRPQDYLQEVKRRERAAEEKKKIQLEKAERRKRVAADKREARLEKACGERNYIAAYIIQKDAVKSKLKSPSTAKFPGYQNAIVRSEEGCIFRILGYVDAQNGFGAIIRTRYETVVKHYPQNESWQVQSIKFLE